MPKLSIKWGQPSDQHGHVGPKSEEIIAVVERARLAPNGQANLSWQDPRSNERFGLKVQRSESGHAPSWYLTCQPSWRENIELWSVCSSDLKLVDEALRIYTSHEGRLGQLVQTHAQVISTSKAPAVQITPTGQAVASSAPYTEVKVGLTDYAASQSKLGSHVQIGDLFCQAELVTTANLAEALSRSEQSGLHVGRVLVESGAISERLLREALKVQSQIREGMLHIELGAQALTLLSNTDLTLEACLQILNWRPEYYHCFQKMGRLMLDAGCAKREDLIPALEICHSKKLPLLRILVQRKVIPNTIAYAVASVRILLAKGTIKYNEALSSIKFAESMNTSLHTWLKREGVLPFSKTGGVRLGELLNLAGIVSEVDLISALELTLLERKQIGQVLIDSGLITESVLGLALELQKKVNGNELGHFEAANSLNDALGEEEAKSILEQIGSHQLKSLPELLSHAGLSASDDPHALLKEIMVQKQNLAYRLVSQQEALKHQLSRDLHDAIIADLLALRRQLLEDDGLPKAQNIEALDLVVAQLRELCHDFAPRQLHDWGLQVFLQDLLERFQLRTGTDCSFVYEVDGINLPESVELHIFRIAQECLNNVEKYSEASFVSLEVIKNDGLFTMAITDNGKGMDQGEVLLENPLKMGGTGLWGMAERVELIRCYYPARFSIKSKLGEGVKVNLELTLGSQ